MTYFADSGRADDEAKVLLSKWRDDLQEYSNVIQDISKQPVNNDLQENSNVIQYVSKQPINNDLQEYSNVIQYVSK